MAMFSLTPSTRPAKPKAQNAFGQLEPEFLEPYQAWKEKTNPQTTSALLTAVDPAIRKGLQIHLGTAGARGKSNIYNSARRLALEALSSYDPQQAKLGTHIVNQLQGLKRIAQKQQRILHVSERAAMAASALSRYEKEMEVDLGRAPTDRELADRMGISVAKLKKVRMTNMGIAAGALQSAEDRNLRFEPAVVKMQNPNYLAEMIYDDLAPVDQKILEYTLGLNAQPKMSNQQIARALHLTPGAVSQRKAKIQQQLDELQTMM